MKVNAQCLNCGRVFEIDISNLTDHNLSHFIGNFAKLKYCIYKGIKCKE